MPWGTVTLNDGRKLPEIGWGSWKTGSGAVVVNQVEQAIETGFSHIDTAQMYGNEAEVGKGIRESGLESGKEIWLTTKWSGAGGKTIQQSIHESLEKLGVKAVDLYLIHSPRLTGGDPAGSWREFEELKKQGLSRSIGVSNFGIAELETIRLAGLSTPSVNQVCPSISFLSLFSLFSLFFLFSLVEFSSPVQAKLIIKFATHSQILLHPYVWARQAPLVAYHQAHGIVTESYSSLTPVTHPGGPLDGPLKRISEAHGATPAAVLFAWCRVKGAVIVTTSRSKERLEDYLHAGDLELSEEDIKDIDEAGAKFKVHQIARRAAWLTLAAGAFVGLKWVLA
ncbi:hypothetical protein P7C70_g4962, partial [Phenoliferia sp. Uapishka_3]